MSLCIYRPSVSLIQQEDDAAARLRQGGPAIVEYGGVECWGIAAHFIGRDHLAWFEDRPNLLIESIEDRWSKHICLGCVRHLLRHALFCFNQDEDRQGIRMLFRPVPYGL